MYKVYTAGHVSAQATRGLAVLYLRERHEVPQFCICVSGTKPCSYAWAGIRYSDCACDAKPDFRARKEGILASLPNHDIAFIYHHTRELLHAEPVHEGGALAQEQVIDVEAASMQGFKVPLAL